MRGTVKRLLMSGLSPHGLVEKAIEDENQSGRNIRFFLNQKDEWTPEILTGFLRKLVTHRSRRGMEGIISTLIKYGADPNGLWKRRRTGERRVKPSSTVRPPITNPFVRGMAGLPEDLLRELFHFLLEEHREPNPIIPFSAVPFVAFPDVIKKLAYVHALIRAQS